MEHVQPLVDAVKPVIQDTITSKSVTPIINSAATSSAYSATKSSANLVLQESSWLWGDQRVWYLAGGLAVGFYFGFRIGVVSSR